MLIRFHFKDLNINSIFDEIKNLEHDDLRIQIELFEKFQNEDEEEALENKEYDLSNLNDAFQAICMKNQFSPLINRRFLELLQLLFHVDDVMEKPGNESDSKTYLDYNNNNLNKAEYKWNILTDAVREIIFFKESNRKSISSFTQTSHVNLVEATSVAPPPPPKLPDFLKTAIHAKNPENNGQSAPPPPPPLPAFINASASSFAGRTVPPPPPFLNSLKASVPPPPPPPPPPSFLNSTTTKSSTAPAPPPPPPFMNLKKTNQTAESSIEKNDVEKVTVNQLMNKAPPDDLQPISQSDMMLIYNSIPKTTRPLKGFNWQKLPNGVINNKKDNLWTEVNKKQSQVNFDFTKLEEIFAKAKRTTTVLNDNLDSDKITSKKSSSILSFKMSNPQETDVNFLTFL